MCKEFLMLYFLEAKENITSYEIFNGLFAYALRQGI